MKKLLLLTLIVWFASLNLFAQNQRVTLKMKDVTIEQIITEIGKQAKLNLFYENSKVNLSVKKSVTVQNETISKVLDNLLKDSGYKHDIKSGQIIIFPDSSSVKGLPKQQAVLREVKGVVKDENGETMPGATIFVKGTSRGTNSGPKGEFSIQVPGNLNFLTISFIGFETQEVFIPQNNNVVIILKPEKNFLQEAVVVGYGTTRREDITGSVGIVDIKNIKVQAPTITLDQALQGQIPGIYIVGSNGQPGAPSKIRIRGTTSLSGSNQPLYVINGIPVVMESNIPVGGTEGQNLGQNLDQQGLNTPIGNLNVNDIESITVLKDASAAAIYGSRAANGVIIINTKSGTIDDTPRFNMDYSMSTSSPKSLSVLDADLFKQVWQTAVRNGTTNNAFTQSVLDGSYFGTANTNWEKEIAPVTPVTQNFNLSIQGGNRGTRYFSTIGANTQDGIYAGSGFDRYSFLLNFDTKMSEKLTFGVKSNTSYSDQKALDGSLTERIYVFRPDVPVKDDKGIYSISSGYSLENPVALSKATNRNKTLLILNSFSIELELLKGIKAKSMLSINYNNGIQNSFYPKYTFRGGWSRTTGDGDGYAQESRTTYRNIMWENTLNYSAKIGEIHQIDAVIGASFEQVQNSYLKAWGTGYFNDVLSNITSATVSRDGSSMKTVSGLASYFGRFNYGINNRYLISLSTRVDGSSKFATENKYAFFPAVSVGWRISQENFMENVDFIKDLKLRSSWGITGQQDFGPYIWRTLYSTSDYGNEPSIVISQLGNDRLKWERTKQFDLGLDFSLFNYRLSGGIGYYQKDTEDAIFAAITPGNTGFSSVLANVGNTRNVGLEFELMGDIIQTKDFNWRMTLNVSHNSNRLTKINDDFKDDRGYVTGFGSGGTLREGSPIGLIYGYVFEKIFQTSEEIQQLNQASSTGIYQNAATSPGDLKFKDISGPEGVPDGVVNTFDQQIIGDVQPDIFGGFSTSIRYKGLTLSAFFTYAMGNDLEWFQQSRAINISGTAVGENKLKEILDAWTPESPSDKPRLVFGDPNQNSRISSYYVHDASYIRMKNLNIGYTFNRETLNKLKFINLKEATIYLSGQNLLTFTKYPGSDPEAANLFNNDISTGRDNNKFPVSKVFTFGLKVGF